MKVILKEEVDKLGESGELVDVSDGYARNYLIPRNLALEATKSNMATYKEIRSQRELSLSIEKRNADLLAKELDSISCTAMVAVGEQDRVFGSVTSQTIAELLKEKGFDIDRKKIMLDEPIKALGVYTVPIRLHTDIEGKLKVWVVKE